MAIEETNNEDIFDFSDVAGFNMDVFNVVAPEEIEDNGEVKPPENNTPPAEGSGGEQSNDIGDSGLEKDPEESVANKDKSEDEKGGSSSSPYSSLANVLIEQSILSPLDSDEKIETVDDLTAAFNKEIKIREYSDLTPTQVKYLEGLRHGIPQQEVEEHIALTNELSSLTPELLESEGNEKVRFALITESFVRKGFNQQRATDMAQRSVDIGKDIEDSKEALTEIKLDEDNKYKQRVQADIQTRAEENKKFEDGVAAVKKQIDSLKEIIPGITLNDKVKQKVFELITKPAAMNGKQPISAIQKKRLENPAEFEIRLNYLFDLTNGFEDFTKLTNKTKTKAVDQLNKILQGQQSASPGGTGNVQQDILDSGGNSFADNLGEIV
jgi:hypothetical protein